VPPTRPFNVCIPNLRGEESVGTQRNVLRHGLTIWRCLKRATRLLVAPFLWSRLRGLGARSLSSPNPTRAEANAGTHSLRNDANRDRDDDLDRDSGDDRFKCGVQLGVNDESDEVTRSNVLDIAEAGGVRVSDEVDDDVVDDAVVAQGGWE